MEKAFLIGGKDLEMVEIIDMLQQKGQYLIDLDLSWGAKLSSYKAYFDTNHMFIGIELIEDIDPPLHYISIDHHLENSSRPSSIEQVAEICGIKLNRYQQLVSANDKGYIPAMEALGASKPEIDQIRNKDRKAQGVTEEDEYLAIKSINEGMTQLNDLIIINSFTPRFSAITDRLYPFNKLLINFANHFAYYGPGIDFLSNHYNKFIKEGRAFHGGGSKGYFELVKDVFTNTEAKKLKNEVIELIIEL